MCLYLPMKALQTGNLWTTSFNLLTKNGMRQQLRKSKFNTGMKQTSQHIKPTLYSVTAMMVQ